MVGMRHLRATLADFDTAADKAPFAGWQGTGDIIVPRVEENYLEPPAFVLCDDAPGAAGSWRRPIMFHNQNLECGHAAIDNVVECRARAAVDQTYRKVAEKVDDMSADAFFNHARQFRSHARQHGRGGKQPKDFSRTFRMHGWSSARKLRFRLQQSGEHDKAATGCKPQRWRVGRHAKIIALSAIVAILPRQACLQAHQA